MDYRGRLAPTPTGLLHLGHAKTFWTASQRAIQHGGTLILRDEDLDQERCQPGFAESMLEDLRWLGISWTEGPDVGGLHAPYRQSQRLEWYQVVWLKLAESGVIYPSPHSRKDVQRALTAPQTGEGEFIFPPELRPDANAIVPPTHPGSMNWRFRVPDGRVVRFNDQRLGSIEWVAGVDFGDFLVWRKDGYPSYELAVVADDHAMQITEVVRGEDLLLSTARQLLIYETLGWNSPEFFHCPLVTDDKGIRLAKRTNALALRTLREQGYTPNQILDQLQLSGELPRH